MSGRTKFAKLFEGEKSVDVLWEGECQKNQCQPLLSPSNSNSLNVVSEALYNHVTYIENVSSESSALYIDNYGFPYYRSNRSSGRFQDAVLVKDIGVSCDLLDEKPRPSAENYLIRRLRLEYNELSSITKKITTYTKDILQNLTLRDRKRDQDIRKLVGKKLVASQYLDDQGIPCLKLRLEDVPVLDMKDDVLSSTKGSIRKDNATQIFSGSAISETDNQTEKRRGQRLEGDEKIKHEKGCRRIFPNNTTDIPTDSSTCSSSSVYNYLMTGKMNSKKQKDEDMKQSDSVVITNWQEISRAVRNRKEATNITDNPSKVQQRINEPLIRKNQMRFPNSSTINNNLYNADFRTVNIRIVKRL